MSPVSFCFFNDVAERNHFKWPHRKHNRAVFLRFSFYCSGKGCFEELAEGPCGKTRGRAGWGGPGTPRGQGGAR